MMSSTTKPPLAPAARMAVMFLVIGLLTNCCGCLGRGLMIANWLTWPRIDAVYTGTVGTSSSHARGSVSCERRYQPYGAVDGRSWSQSAPCIVLIGPSPDEGEVVSLAIQPNGGSQGVTATEAFGMGFVDLFMVLMLAGAPAVLLFLQRRGKLRAPSATAR